MPKLSSFVKNIDRFNERFGNLASFLIIPMAGIVFFEVIARYVFDRPTMWAHEISELLLGAFSILGLAYTHRFRAHVNVDIIISRFSLKTRAIINLMTSIFFFIFCGVMLWKVGEFALLSLSRGEHSQTPFSAPLYPVKCLMWFGILLMTLQGLAQFIRDLNTALNGKEIK